MNGSTKKSMERYVKICREYLYAADLLLDAYEKKGHSVQEDEVCRPLFYLLGHACECALKAKIQEICPTEERKLKTHKLGELLRIIRESSIVEIDQKIVNTIFFLANSHCVDSGEKNPSGTWKPNNSYDSRYGDYQFSDKEWEKREKALLEKQKQQGLEADNPVDHNILDEMRKKLEPEFSNYYSYIAASMQCRPESKNAISSIRALIETINEKQAA